MSRRSGALADGLFGHAVISRAVIDLHAAELARTATGDAITCELGAARPTADVLDVVAERR